MRQYRKSDLLPDTIVTKKPQTKGPKAKGEQDGKVAS